MPTAIARPPAGQPTRARDFPRATQCLGQRGALLRSQLGMYRRSCSSRNDNVDLDFMVFDARPVAVQRITAFGSRAKEYKSLIPKVRVFRHVSQCPLVQGLSQLW